ncbi:transporter substrate-binding domain-containing protein [Lactococcus nasutitermitis]|uniref:Transporter substrate-binding domain-containing protein n=1 Tax=Lactococcus nasutitermitis TaxID=1652957 RepID=A0ABV9JBY0_9LACT|nr:transporter substrate-binding domain-containing protein [Lactococcus nasutitermitis]
MNKNIKKIVSLSTLALASATVLSLANTQTAQASTKKPKTITVAISSDSNPYEYMKDGKLTGFEYDILHKADKDLKQYKFKYQVYDDSALLSALDGGRAQIAANNFGKTKARAEKYLFSYPTAEGINAIFSSKKEDITKITQLAGKKTEIPTGTNYGDILTTWNEKHPSKKITVTYSQRALADRLEGISSGQLDFLFASKSAAENLVKTHAITGVVDHIPTDLNKYPSFKTYEYFVLDNSQTKLQKALNKEVKKFAKDGYLKKLSEKYFGDNQVPEASQFKTK